MLTVNYSRLCSHAIAWQQTRNMEGFPRLSPPVDDMIWATSASKHASSMIHLDANGFATAVDQLTGSKYWVLCSRRQGNPLMGPGDMSSVNWAGKSDVDDAHRDCFNHEAVVQLPDKSFAQFVT